LSSEIYKSLAEKRKVSIFESPTGSGKSFAIIVGVLGWMEDSRNGAVIRSNIPKPVVSQLPNWFVEYEEEYNPPIGGDSK
jgi:Rad3-related DNA helicase